MGFVNEGSVLAIGILFIILGSAAVTGRFYVRRQGKSGLGVDDWLCIPSLTLVIGSCAIMITGAATHTLGSHSPPHLGAEAFIYDSPKQDLLERLEIPFNLIQIVALAFIKLSILFLYRRIFRGRTFDVASWTLIGVVIAWAVAFFIAILAACGTSINAMFGALAPYLEKCTNILHIYLVYAVTDVAVDLAILILPIPWILGLHMPLSRKLAVIGIFLIGTLAITCGLVRMAYFAGTLAPALLSEPKVGGIPSDDDIGVVSLLEFWAMLEVGVAMVTACLPTLRPLFHNSSLQSLIRSLRSSISLRSDSSRGRLSTSKEDSKDTESKTAIVAFPHTEHVGTNASCSYDGESYAMGNMSRDDSGTQTGEARGIWRAMVVEQTSEDV